MKQIELAPKTPPLHINSFIKHNGFTVKSVWKPSGPYGRYTFVGFRIKQDKFFFPLKFFISKRRVIELLDLSTFRLLEILSVEEMINIVAHEFRTREFLNYPPLSGAAIVSGSVSLYVHRYLDGLDS